MDTESDKEVVRPSATAGFSRRNFLTGAGLLGAGLFGAGTLAGCGGRSAEVLTSGSVNLEMWTHDPSYVATFSQAASDQQIMAGSAFRPSITEVAADGASLVSRTITQAVAGREGPDLLGVLMTEFPRMMKRQMAENLFVDLTALTTEFGDDLLRTVPYTVDGKVYAIDSDACISVFYYRSDEFAKLGIDPELATWEEYLEVGGRVNEETGQSIGMVSNGDNVSILSTYLQYLLQRGGSLFDESGELAIDSDESADVMEFMRKGVENGSLMVLGDPYGSAAAAALKGGNLIATVMPSWYNVYGLQANAPDQKGNWRMRTIPKFAAGGHIASCLGGTGFAVGVDSPNREAGTDLLRRTYLTPEGQLLRYQVGGFLPTLKSLYQAPEFLAIEDEFLGGQRPFDVFAEAAADLPDYRQAETLQQLVVAMGAPLLAVYKGDLNPAQAIRASVQAYKEQTRQGT